MKFISLWRHYLDASFNPSNSQSTRRNPLGLSFGRLKSSFSILAFMLAFLMQFSAQAQNVPGCQAPSVFAYWDGCVLAVDVSNMQGECYMLKVKYDNGTGNGPDDLLVSNICNAGTYVFHYADDGSSLNPNHLLNTYGFTNVTVWAVDNFQPSPGACSPTDDATGPHSDPNNPALAQACAACQAPVLTVDWVGCALQVSLSSLEGECFMLKAKFENGAEGILNANVCAAGTFTYTTATDVNTNATIDLNPINLQNNYGGTNITVWAVDNNQPFMGFCSPVDLGSGPHPNPGACPQCTSTSVDIQQTGGQNPLCAGNIATLDAQGMGVQPYTFVWDQGLTGGSASNSIHNVAPTTTTTYSVTITDANNCTAVDSYTVNVSPSPTIFAGNDISVCSGQTVQLTSNPSGGSGSYTQFAWYDGNGGAPLTQQNPTVTFTTPVLYTVIVTDSNGCTGSDQIQITIGANPSFSPGGPYNVCAGQTIQVTMGNGSGGTGPYSYFWQDNFQGQTRTIGAGNYTVAMVDANGCSDSQSFTVGQNPNPTANAGSNQSICLGEAATLTASGGVSYQWSNNLGNTQTVFASPTFPTTYAVTVTDANGCTDSDQVLVTVNNNTSANAGADQSICLGGAATLTASGGVSYQWSNSLGNNQTVSASPNTTTTYTVIVTDANGCTDNDQVTVTVNNNTSANAGPDQTVCAGGSATLNASGGIGYQWSNGLGSGSSKNVTPATTTTYTVTVTDNNGCTDTDQVTVVVNDNPAANAGVDQSICAGETTTIAVDGFVSAGNTYSWQGLGTGTSFNVTPNSTTTYTLTVTNNSTGCQSTDQVVVTVNPLPSVNAGNDFVKCYDDGLISLSASGSGGTPSYNYAWSNGLGNSATTGEFNVVTTTTYTVTITDMNGCQATDDVTVTVNVPNTNAGPDQTVCEGTTVTLSGSGTFLGSYQWLGGGGLPAPPSGPNWTFTPTVQSSYTLEVTDFNGCKSYDSVLVLFNTNNSANAGPDQAICIGSSANLSASGGSQYTWSNGAGNSSSVTVSPTTTTTYTVTVTDGNTCTDTDQVTVTVNENTSANAGADATICTGFSTVLTASGGTSYAWSNGAGNSSSVTVSPTTTTTYTVTVTDANGCIDTDQVTVNVNANISANAGADATICTGFSTQLTASGGTSYAWSNGAGSTSSVTVSPTTTTTYTVTATDSNGCTDTDQVTVNVNANTSANAGADATICTGFSTQLTASGGTSYAWSNGAGSTSSVTVSPTTTTSYTVTVTDANGCTDTDAVTVNVNANSSANAGPDATICTGFSTVLTASGGVSYNWDNSLGAGASHTVSPTTTTNYSVTVTDANGCTDVDAVTVNVNANSSANAGPDATICTGFSTVLTASGGVSYNWDNSLGAGASHTVSPTTTTNYSVTVTDANGCTDVDAVTVNVNANISADAGADATICTGFSTDLLASGGVSYDWDNGLAGGASQTVNPTTTTTYTVTVTDANGCTDVDAVTVTVNENVSADAGADATICTGFSTDLLASGGTSYSWDNGLGAGAAQTVNPTTTTTYTVTVTDGNGCTDVDAVTVTVNANTSADAGADATICTGFSTDLLASGGVSYVWDNGLGAGASQTVNPTATTTYSVTVTDANGCTDIDDVTVTVNENTSADAGVDQIICVETSVSLLATGGVSYEWDNGLGAGASQTVSPTVNTTYSVTVTDANGCTDTDDVTVTVNSNSSAEAGPDQTVCDGTEVTMAASGGVSYLWSDGLGTSPNATFTPSVGDNVYTVTVTDANGCTDTDEVTVTVEAKAKVGNFVWMDSNYNGIQDANEMGLNGVTVDLLDATGTVVATTTTATVGGQAGYYEFEVCQGQYRIDVMESDVPDKVVTLKDVGADTSDSDINPDGTTVLFTLLPGDNDQTRDAGFAGLIDLSLVKTVNDNTPNVGDVVTYTITVSNAGPNDATNVSVQDVIPSGLSNVTNISNGGSGSSLLTWDGLSIANGASVTLTYNATVESPIGGGNFANSASITGGNAAVVLLKSASNNSPNVGDVITYTVTVENTSTSAVSNITINDVVPNGLSNVSNITGGGSGSSVITWSNITIPAESSVSYTYNATVGAISYKNVAQVTAADQFDIDSTPNNDDGDQSEDDEDPEVITPEVADLNLVKTVNDATPSVGDVVTFTIAVTNEGPSTATGVSVRDAVPNGYTNISSINAGGSNSGSVITWSNQTIASGAQATFTFNAEVVAPGANTDYDNVARIESSDQFDTDSTPGNAADSDGDGNIGSQDSDDDQDLGDEDDGDNASVTPTGSITGYVLEDTDNDDVGDSPIAGVTITLTDNVTGATQMTQTDVNGYYEFTDLPAGSYTITEQDESTVDPDFVDVFDGDETPEDGNDGVDGLDDDSIQVTLTLGENDDDNNFVEEQLGSISGTVELDTDNDDIGDTPQVGVTVTLQDENGNVVATTMTNSMGDYLFDNLEPGNYVVVVGDPADSQSVSDEDESDDGDVDDTDSTVDNTITVTLTPGEDDDDNNFVDEELVAVGDYVWFDANGNGLQDANEDPIQGVTVTLLDENGATVSTMMTDVDGEYLFEDLAPGIYQIQFTSPTGFAATLLNVNGDASDVGSDDSDVDPATGLTQQFELTNGETDLDLDAGFYETASLGNYVWLDENGNGLQDADEDGVNGVNVMLFDASDLNTAIATMTTSTNAGEDGYYLFTDLAPGDYVVKFTAPNGSELTTQDVDGLNTDATDSNNDSDADTTTGLSHVITLSSGEQDLKIDAGIYEAVSLGNFVWDDVNNNGIFDAGEMPIQGVTVTLFRDLNNDNTPDVSTMLTDVTDASGNYLFDNLQPGDYIVVVDPTNFANGSALTDYISSTGNDDGMGMAPDADSSTDDTDDNGYFNGGNIGIISKTVTLSSREEPTSEDGDNNSNLTVDFGFFKPAAIGNYVWEDINADGIQGGTEQGINNVTVTLYDALTDLPITSMQTISNPDFPTQQGYYLFDNLIPGDYYVEFETPVGYIATNPGMTSDDRDSDANDLGNKGLNTSPVYSLDSGDRELTVDAGFYQTAEVGDYVWLDFNGTVDNAQDAGDVGVNGIVVNLFLSDGTPVASQTTRTEAGQDGYYLFTGLPAGEYVVQFELPNAYTFVVPGQANDDDDSDVVDFINGTTLPFTVVPGDMIHDIDAGITWNVLPIELASFTANYNNGKDVIDLAWETQTEINSDRFEIERRHESESTFNYIGEQKAEGNSTNRVDYDFIDTDVEKAGDYFYRLKMIDLDGYTEYSEIRVASVERKVIVNANIYPNPASRFINVDVETGERALVKATLLTDQGRLVRSNAINETIEAGSSQLNIDLDGVPGGAYLLRIEIGSEVSFHKILVIK